MREIVLRAIGTYIALVDDEDYEELSKYKWNILSYTNIYVVRNPTKEEKKAGYPTHIRMHRQIMGVILDSSVQIDHRNRNTLDNQRTNLRVSNQTQNLMNTEKRDKEATSIYKGVHWEPLRSRWAASIRIEGRKVTLGRFTNEVDAAIAYNNKAQELYGEFAYLNTIKIESNEGST